MAVKRPDHAVSVELEIPFHDCDPLFVVWHGRYLEYMEVGRQALLRSHRLDIPHMIELDLRMYVTEVRCRYNAPLTYGERVRVTSWFRPHPFLVKVVHELWNASRGRISARASTLLALADARGTLLPALPEVITGRLPELEP